MNKIDLTSGWQKGVAVLLLALAVGFSFWILPPLSYILANMFFGAIIVFVVSLLAANYKVIWHTFLNISWNLTKKLISADKIGHMYRYYYHIVNLIHKLKESITTITGAKKNTEKKISELNTQIKDNARRIESLEQNKPEGYETLIKAMKNRIGVDNNLISKLEPRKEMITKQLDFLTRLYNAWLADSDTLKYTLDAKAEEYKILKESAEALGTASDFLRGQTEEYKLYEESLKQIEESITTSMSTIEIFERDALPKIISLETDASMWEKEGERLLDTLKIMK